MLFVILSGSLRFETVGSFSSIAARLGAAGKCEVVVEREIRARREMAKRPSVRRRVVILGIGRPKIMYCFGIVND